MRTVALSFLNRRRINKQVCRICHELAALRQNGCPRIAPGSKRSSGRASPMARGACQAHTSGSANALTVCVAHVMAERSILTNSIHRRSLAARSAFILAVTTCGRRSVGAAGTRHRYLVRGTGRYGRTRRRDSFSWPASSPRHQIEMAYCRTRLTVSST